jgi:phosphatidate cytidylyltransferase
MSMAPTEAALRRRRNVQLQPVPADGDSDTVTDTDVDACGDDDFASGRDDERDPVSKSQAPATREHGSGENKLAKLVKRLFVGTSLLFGLICILRMGHLTTLGVVLVLQVLMFRELVNVRYRTRAVREIPLFRTTQWGWFATCMLYSYGASFSEERLLSLIRSPTLVRLLPYIQASVRGQARSELVRRRKRGTSQPVPLNEARARSLAGRQSPHIPLCCFAWSTAIIEALRS